MRSKVRDGSAPVDYWINKTPVSKQSSLFRWVGLAHVPLWKAGLVDHLRGKLSEETTAIEMSEDGFSCGNRVVITVWNTGK